MVVARPARFAIAASAAALTLATLAGCSTSTKEPAASAPMSSMAMDAPALVGPGCASYAAANPSGPASVGELAKVPVATAAGQVPLLKTLTQAVSGQLNPQVNLVDTLNGAEFTVFAPTDDAFAKLPPETVEKLKTDADLLGKILKYHVVAGQAAPNAIAGEHKTVEGTPVTVSGSGDALKVGDAGVVCGGIKASNATIYLIDSVLMPPS
ncbi:MAG: fasciclin domain-containing protein [Gordonia sp. (in: high G+C Gram-positive bacteria)]|uniref:fasciclin domain-containing protein n=1 Tax=Gordonia sp. (in: high G+C Gram-positive bacteria) TaxID=84139 RepID=UPI0039E4E793